MLGSSNDGGGTTTTAAPRPQESGAAYVRRLFLDNLGLSIDEAEKTLDRHKIGIPKHEVSRIRMEVRQRVQAGCPQAVPPIIRKYRVQEQQQQQLPFNPPRLILKVPRPVVAVPAEDLPKAEPTLKEKQDWLESWMLDHPNSSVVAARQALRDRFGSTMSTKTIADTVRLTHEIARVEPEGHQNCVPDGLASLPKLLLQLRQLGVQSVEIQDYHYRVTMVEEAKPERVPSASGQRGAGLH